MKVFGDLQIAVKPLPCEQKAKPTVLDVLSLEKSCSASEFRKLLKESGSNSLPRPEVVQILLSTMQLTITTHSACGKVQLEVLTFEYNEPDRRGYSLRLLPQTGRILSVELKQQESEGVKLIPQMSFVSSSNRWFKVGFGGLYRLELCFSPISEEEADSDIGPMRQCPPALFSPV